MEENEIKWEKRKEHENKIKQPASIIPNTQFSIHNPIHNQLQIKIPYMINRKQFISCPFTLFWGVWITSQHFSFLGRERCSWHGLAVKSWALPDTVAKAENSRFEKCHLRMPCAWSRSLAGALYAHARCISGFPLPSCVFQDGYRASMPRRRMHPDYPEEASSSCLSTSSSALPSQPEFYEPFRYSSSPVP